jgi:hypothetical protein
MWLVHVHGFPALEPEPHDGFRSPAYVYRMGVILFMVASAVIGTRLLVLYAKLREPPELFLGSAYLLAGTLGWGGLLVGTLMTPKGQSLAEPFQAWSVVVGDLGTYCFYLFVWYVFRRESLVAKVALGFVALVFVTSLTRDTFIAHVTFGPPPGTVTTIAGATARAAVFAWTGVEAFSSYFAFRRRARIGLGNPIVASRLLLWGISSVVTFALSTTAMMLYVTATDNADATFKQNQAGGLYGALALVAATALWFAFFPPRAYLAWLEKSAEPSDGR